jgi:type I restriction enzyme S subunit
MDKPKLRFKVFKDEWAFVTMRDVAEKITDGTHDTPKPTKTGIPYLTAIHIKDSGIDYENCYFLPEEEHQKIYKRCNPEKGDMLIVNIGAGTSTCAINTVDYQFSLKNVALVKPNRQRVIPEYLVQIQRRNAAKQFIQLTSGGAQPFLALKEIGKIKVPLCSLGEQQKISSFLSAIDKKISLLVKKQELLIQFKKGVMQKIFSQEIRFKDSDGSDFTDWEYVPLEQVLDYEQPGRYLVSSTEYSDDFDTPVLTAGKTFLLGYTDEINGIYTDLPVIIFDDFTTAFKFVDFPFKAKSSAMKMLKNINSDNCLRYIYEAMCRIDFQGGDEHKRYWISQYSKITIPLPHHDEQIKILEFSVGIDKKIEIIKSKLELTKQYKQGLLQQMFI